MTKIYIKPNGELTKDSTKGYEEYKSPLMPNGTVIKNSDYLQLLETKEDGSLYTYYNADYTADMTKENKATDAKVLSDANEDYEKSLAALTKGVPSSEINTWTKQELEARGFEADNSFPTPLIDALASNRGIPKEYLVSKIIEKADAYAVAVGTYTGIRQKIEDELTD